MRLYLYAAIAAALIGGVTLYTIDQRNAGAAAEREKQEKANAEFRVKSARGAVDYDVCDRAGGMFDFSTGRCKLP